MSQEEMAQYLGISRQGYSKYENDKSEPSYDTLIKIANLFMVSIDELVGREKQTTLLYKEPSLYDQLGITEDKFQTYTAYQQEVLEWAATGAGPLFKNKSDNLDDMMEQLEIAYEVYKVMNARKKNK